jgi:hypothetical protein
MTSNAFQGFEKLIPEDHRELVVRFFLVFSRFEYALKRAGFVQGNKSVAMANWERFSSQYRVKYLPSRIPAMKAAWNYFSRFPPSKQILSNGSLDWSISKLRTNQPELTWLLVNVRTVRNNLFHGGKYDSFGSIEEPARNKQLLKHTLEIIEACVKFDETVASFYRS